MPTAKTPLPRILQWENVPIVYIDIDNQREQVVDLVDRLLARMRECRVHPAWIEQALALNNIRWDRRYTDRQWRYDYRRGKSSIDPQDIWFLPVFAGIFGVRVCWAKKVGLEADRKSIVVSYGVANVDDLIFDAVSQCWSGDYYGTEKMETSIPEVLSNCIRIWLNPPVV